MTDPVLERLDERTLAIKEGMDLIRQSQDSLSDHLKDHGGRIRTLEDDSLRSKAKIKLAGRVGAVVTALGGAVGGWFAS